MEEMLLTEHIIYMKYEIDLHTHTMASTHAYSTIIENCRAASIKGLKAVAMTDHAPMEPDSPHIWHFENLHILPLEIEGVRVLKGVEANIYNAEGELDISERILSKLEWVVASFHNPVFYPDNEEDLYKVYKKVCQNVHVDLIGHPTAGDVEYNAEGLVKLFKEYEKLVEFNEASFASGRTKKQKLVDLVKACKKYGVLVAVDSDAHFCDRIGDVSNVKNLLTELEFPNELIVNRDFEIVKERILKKRPWVEF